MWMTFTHVWICAVVRRRYILTSFALLARAKQSTCFQLRWCVSACSRLSRRSWIIVLRSRKIAVTDFNRCLNFPLWFRQLYIVGSILGTCKPKLALTQNWKSCIPSSNKHLVFSLRSSRQWLIPGEITSSAWIATSPLIYSQPLTTAITCSLGLKTCVHLALDSRYVLHILFPLVYPWCNKPTYPDKPPFSRPVYQMSSQSRYSIEALSDRRSLHWRSFPDGLS